MSKDNKGEKKAREDRKKHKNLVRDSSHRGAKGKVKKNK